VVSGPVRLGDGAGSVVVAAVLAGGGVVVGLESPPPLPPRVQAAASIRTTVAIGRNRLGTGKIVPDHLARAQPTISRCGQPRS
jgi:hypothetical protein